MLRSAVIFSLVVFSFGLQLSIATASETLAFASLKDSGNQSPSLSEKKGQQFAQSCTVASRWTENYTCPQGKVKSVQCWQCVSINGQPGLKECQTKTCNLGD